MTTELQPNLSILATKWHKLWVLPLFEPKRNFPCLFQISEEVSTGWRRWPFRRKSTDQCIRRSQPPTSTMGLLSILKKMKKKEREVRLLVLGLDNAGKTTVCLTLEAALLGLA